MTASSSNSPSRLVKSFLSLSGAEAIGKIVMLATFAYVRASPGRRDSAT
jgi:hypothetical protein